MIIPRTIYPQTGCSEVTLLHFNADDLFNVMACVCVNLQSSSPTGNLTWPDINHCALSHLIFTRLSTVGAEVVWG